MLRITKYMGGKEVTSFSNVTSKLARTIISEEFPTLTDLDLFVSGENAIISIEGVILRIEKDKPAPTFES